MATTKKGARAARKGPSRPKGATKSKVDAKREALLSLPASYERKLDRSVGDVLYDANNLIAAATKEWARLSKKGGLAKDTLERLRDARRALEALEAEWTALRKRTTPAEVERARKDGRALRSDANAALRHFLRDDAEVQARLAEVAEGDGDADLIDDLRRLADLLDVHATALTVADLPKGGGDALRKSAEVLSNAAAERSADTDAAAAQALRNRAFWQVRELSSEVRSAGRYVFRKEPKVAARFVDPAGLRGSSAAPPAPPGEKKA